MKHLRMLTVLVAMMAASSMSFAQTSGSCGANLTWEYDGAGTLTITGTGAMDDYDGTTLPWKDFKESITSVVFPSGITKIGTCAFDHAGLTSVTIPATVLSIRINAFNYCESLASVTFEDGSELVTIGDYAFRNCTALTSITIPNTVTEIGTYAFAACPNLSEINVSWATPLNIWVDIIEPARQLSVTLHIPYGYLSSYTSNDYWEKFTIVDPHALSGSCSTAGDVTYAFDESTHTLTLSSSGTGTGHTSSYSAPSQQKWSTYRKLIQHVVVEEGVTQIGSRVFMDCDQITSISFPSTLLKTVSNAFENCTGLTSVVFPEGLTMVGYQLFKNCTNLQSVTIPSTANDIRETIFTGCTALTDIYVHMASPGDISTQSSAFSGIDFSSVTLHVPSGKKSIYEATAPWSNFANIVQTPMGYCGADLTWLYDASTHKLTISGTGDMYSWSSNSDVPWFIFRKEIASVVLPDGLTGIGDYAFQECSNLSAIAIPSTVTEIRQHAFYGCSSLTSIIVPAGVTEIHSRSFFGCTNLASINIPSGVTAIGMQSFYGCSSLTSIIVPAGVTEIGLGAFKNCSSLTSITIPSGVTVINESTFEGCSNLASATLPNNITEINQKAFYGCSSLTSIVLPGALTKIWGYAFQNCTGLMSITIPANVTIIYQDAFRGCSGLESITIPSGVTHIASSAFRDCSSLTSVDIPGSIIGLTNYVFKGCSSLTDVTVHWTDLSGLTITSNIFDGLTVAGINLHIPCETKSIYEAADPWSGFNIVDPCPSGTCGADLTWLYNSTTHVLTLSGTGDLYDFTMGNAPWYAYRADITSVVLPDGITGIGDYAFSGCSNLTTIDIPASVTEIGSHAFDGCTGLTDVTVHWTDLTGVTTNPSAFGGVTTSAVNLHIPFGTQSIYAAAPVWQDFLSAPVAADYTRMGLTAGKIGTLYVGHATTAHTGATFYTLAGRNASKTELYFEEVTGQLADNAPYIFEATDAKIELLYADPTFVPDNESKVNGLAGTLVDKNIAADPAVYYISGNRLWSAVSFDGTTDHLEVVANRCWIEVNDVPEIPAPSPAPGKRYLTLGMNIASGIDQITDDQSPVANKILRNGNLYILRDGKIYSVLGETIK